MDRPGKLTYKILSESDIPAIEEFCNQCKILGYENNSSLEKMKFSSATFFGAYFGEKIVSLAGVHQLPEINQNAWRCLFRGAQLPGYTPQWSGNFFKSGIHFSQFLYMQINYVTEKFPDAEFFISTNISSSVGAKSSRMNNIMMPRIEKLGIWSLYLKDFTLYNVSQNIWKVNVPVYLERRREWFFNEYGIHY